MLKRRETQAWMLGLGFVLTLSLGMAQASLQSRSSSSSSHTAPRKIALLIANNDYSDVAPLKNSINDAKLIGKSLQAAGFKVITKTNLSQKNMQTALIDFAYEIDSNTISFIYYSGHGIEINGENYLVPTDFTLLNDKDMQRRMNDENYIRNILQAQSIGISRFLSNLGPKAKGSLNIIAWDAGRDNPIASIRGDTQFKGGMLKVKGGLKTVGARANDQRIETFIAYATSSGKFSSEGAGDNSPYAIALAKNLSKPNLSLEVVFRKVGADVIQATDGQQVPTIYSNVSREFIFIKK